MREVIAVIAAACGTVAPSVLPPIDAAADAPPSLPPPSCRALSSTCGSRGTDSCCASLTVEHGMFYRSFDVAADGNSGTATAPATLGDFRLDKYEITVGRFRAFVAAGQGTRVHPPAANAGAHAGISVSGWDPNWNVNLPADKPALLAALNCDTKHTWTDVPGPRESHPMGCLSWYEVMAFCAWDRGYMPTEAEWNYAAAGGGQQRAYPWSVPAASTAIDADHASYGAMGDPYPVGTKPSGDGRWGQSDLAGNMYEWTLDWWAPYETPCVGCAYLHEPAGPSTPGRVLRGGSYAELEYVLRTAERAKGDPSYHAQETGGRCARSP